MKTLLLLATLLTCACGDENPDPYVDEYVRCEDYCKPMGVEGFGKIDSAYYCKCFERK